MRKIYTSVDLGSDSIKIVVGEILNKKFNVLAATTIKSRGIKRGLITNAEDIISSLREAISDIESKIGFTIDRVIASVPSYYSSFDIVNAKIDIDEEEKITGSDIVRVLRESVNGKVKEGRELVSIIPIYFIVNGKKNIRDPKGLIANSLGVKAMMVTVPSKNVQSIISLFESIGISVLDVNLGSVADYYECRSNVSDETLSAVVNIGAEVTTVSLFNKGIIINSEIIQIGSKNIDNDLSYVYKISNREAKKLKETFAVAHKKFSRVNDVKEVITDNKDLINVTQYDVSQVVMSRLTEILKLSKKQSYLLTNREISYIIVTGGGSEIPAMNYLVDEVCGSNAIVGSINTIGIRNNMYSTASGLIKCFDEKLNLRDKKISMINFEGEDKIENDTVLDKVVGYLFDD